MAKSKSPRGVRQNPVIIVGPGRFIRNPIAGKRIGKNTHPNDFKHKSPALKPNREEQEKNYAKRAK